MPSPFPGMDPFLEDPDLFPDFHETFVVDLKKAIQPLLPESYYAASGSRIWIEYARRRIVPDVALMEKKKDRRETGKLAAANAVAMLEEEGAVFVGVPQDEVHEAYLEIYRKKGEQHRLVTSIELLSPGNKTPGQELRRQYLRKQREILRSKTSLIEIDLLHTASFRQA